MKQQTSTLAVTWNNIYHPDKSNYNKKAHKKWLTKSKTWFIINMSSQRGDIFFKFRQAHKKWLAC